MDREDIREEVLSRVEPGEEEREENRERFADIRDFIADEYGRDAELMGSTAKGTFMAGDKDLDIFVFFDTSVGEETLEEEGLAIGEAVFEEFDGAYAVEYAEHPYTKGDIDGYDVEIVPAYDVASGQDIRSSVDRTPFHREWVNGHLSAEEKREVVLLKAFLRGRGLYGSTLRVQGFSGYLCELLVAEYGSFEAVLEAAVDWEEDAVLDPAAHHESLPNHLREKFSEESLVVVDPVDPERNVASVLSDGNHARFVHEAWKFRRDPSLDAFFPEDPAVPEDAVAEAAERRGDFVCLEFPTPDLIDDVLYPQMRRLRRRVETELEENDFRIFHSGFHVGEDRTRLLFELFSAELPDSRKHVGPKVFHNTEHVANFSDKYADVWVDGTRLATVVEREHVTADALLDDLLSGDLGEQGVPRNLVDAVAEAGVRDLPTDGADWRRFLRDAFHLTT